ncbi:hypothetical protein SERLA73DRAFT_189569 [Serpula lacrymans var. lacrymans S7.3]|uniref:Cytochrome P450 n=2 Tax=Serpula lacrymans var. lacrymans TaxID=341189 RepID=F8QDY6_SERL3|nr:uncharacterized protein SERLADRAFT_480423 [Serpula lacrymans var. lacrymans S7.9]EGN93361.1 hypothetical protein SERLA73DRAFT_189569 [Serpula lacrymans var. lacrymans S7.3]EGO18742.1 hypothetical protein SERLADRAFT_480423 [Serpula lacrymans var. lacrymans S7.9]
MFTCMLVGIYTFSAILCTITYRLSPFHPLYAFPGPRTWWISNLVFSYISFGGKRHVAIDSLHKIYGPFVRIGPNMLSINTLSATCIYGAQLNMEKSDMYRAPGHGDTVSLFYKQKTAKIHADRRRIWSAGFTSAALSHFFPPLERRLWELMNCIEKRQLNNKTGTVDISECICHWSYDFMGEMVFGGCNNIEMMTNGDPEKLVYGGKMAMVMQDSIGHTSWLMDLVLHLPKSKYLFRLIDIGADMIRTRIQADKDVTMRDLSSYLLEGDAQSGEKLSQADLELDSAVAVQGGSDNTAVIISLAFYFMLVQPKYYEMLRAELDGAFSDCTGHLDNTKLANLTFLNAILNETLRLCTFFFLPRIVPPGGLVLEGNYIPGGTVVAIATHSLHTSPAYFSPAPQEFLPERWISGALGLECSTDKNALMPFSSGPHGCIGKVFAHQEMRLVIARLVLVYDMKLAEGFDAKSYLQEMVHVFSTTLQKPLLVNVTRRSGIDLEKTSPM